MNRRITIIIAASIILMTAAVAVYYYGVSHKQNAAISGDNAVAPPLPDTVTTAFYNVENLFDLNLDGTEYDEYKPGWHGWSAEIQKTRLRSTADVVTAIGADIIGLCEIENANTLRELAEALDKAGAPYPYAAVAEVEGSATVTALLSAFPIVEKRVFPVENSRSILEAAVARGGDTLRVFVNHWPSKRHPESARLAAAQILRRRLDELASTDYVVMGDFNSNYDEYATFHTSGHDDTRGKTGINHVMKTVTDGARPSYPPKFVCKGDLPACGDCHYNPWLDVEESARMSYVYKGAKNTIDNMLLPPALFDTAGYSYLDGSFRAFTRDGRLLKDGVPYRRQMYYKGKEKYHKGDGYSDHLPIVAKLIRAKLVAEDDSVPCADANPSLAIGDFAVSTDGWLNGDGRFSVERDAKYARTGSHSLRVSGMHESENRTAARATLTASQSQKFLTLSIRGEGKLSIRLRRPEGKWVYHNAPDFNASKTAKYKDSWKSTQWTNLKLPLPPLLQDEFNGTGNNVNINNNTGNTKRVNNNDVEVELRAGKGERFSVWIDRIRLE